jgi:SAM-dependent methyltransferase
MRRDAELYADHYQELVQHSIRFSGRDHAFFARAKADCLVQLMRSYVGDPRDQRVLDVGCGPGITDRYLRGLRELVGVDLSERMVERARAANPSVRYHVADAKALPFPPNRFDVAFAIGLLHHVPERERRACVAEISRLLRPGGICVLFEHNPLNPLTRIAVHRCEFDEDAVLFGRREAERLLRHAGLDAVEYGYMLVTPWRGPISLWLERRLRRLPLGAQYFVLGRA